MGSLFYEDVSVGFEKALGSCTASKDEMMAFAEKYDPLAIHTDEEAAAQSVHGGIIASGFYVLALTNRIVVDGFRKDAMTRGGLGMKELEFRTPVYPGDELFVVVEIVDKRVSESNPGTGLVHQKITVSKAADEQVLEYVSIALWGRREVDE